MTVTMRAPRKGQSTNDVKTLADQMSDLTSREVEGVSEETIQLIIKAAATMNPLRVQNRHSWQITEDEARMVSDCMVELIELVYENSGHDKEVGIELATFAVRRLGYKFKTLRDFASQLESHHMGSRKKVVALVTRQLTASPGYKGPR